MMLVLDLGGRVPPASASLTCYDVRRAIAHRREDVMHRTALDAGDQHRKPPWKFV